MANNTFYKFCNKVKVAEFICKILAENPDYIVPVKKKGCKLLKYAELDCTTMREKVRYIDYFQNNDIDLTDKKVCVIDDATKYTSRLSHYREIFSEKGANVSTYSYIAHELLKSGIREQYDEKAIICKYLSESTYQEYLTQQSRVLLEQSNSFDIDHFVIELQVTEDKYNALFEELYKVGDIEFVNDKYTPKEIEKISIINIDYYDTESLFDSSVAQGALQKIRMTYNKKSGLLFIAPLSYPVWDSKLSSRSELFSNIRFELPYAMTDDISNKGIYFNLVYAFQVMLFKYFINVIDNDSLLSGYKVLDSDLVSYVGCERAEAVINSTKTFLDSNYVTSTCSKRHQIDVPRKGKADFHSLNEMMRELRNHYNGLVNETQTLIGVRYYLAYEELIERYKGHENLLKWIDVLCDRGVLVTRNYNENGVYYRACRSGETNFDFDEQKAGAFVYLSINVCGDETRSGNEVMCSVSPTYINKVLANFVYDYPSEEYDCHSLITKPHDFGPLTYITDEMDGYNEIPLYDISTITKFCMYDDKKRRFYAYSMKNEKVQNSISEIIGMQDYINYTEAITYFDFIRLLKESKKSANFLNALAICREEDSYYKHVRYNLDWAYRRVRGAKNAKSRYQIDKYLRDAATYVSSARTKLDYNQRDVFDAVKNLDVPVVYRQIQQKILDSFEFFSDDFEKTVCQILRKISIEEYILVNFELYINLYDTNYLIKALSQYVKQKEVQLEELQSLADKYLAKKKANNIAYEEILDDLNGISNKLNAMISRDYAELVKIKAIPKKHRESRKKIVNNIRNYFSKKKIDKVLIVSFSYSGYANINDEKEANIVKKVQDLVDEIELGGKVIIGQEVSGYGIYVTYSLSDAIDFSKRLWNLSSSVSNVFFRMGCTVGESLEDVEEALIKSNKLTRVVEGRNAFVMDKKTYQILQDYESDNDTNMMRITQINDDCYEFDKDRQPYVVKKYAKNTDNSVRIGIITVLDEEYITVETMLENHVYVEFPGRGAGHQFTIGEIKGHDGGVHKVALAITSGDGNNKAAIRAEKMLQHFPKLDVIFMVGIAGGAPALPLYAGSDTDTINEKHVRLGDIVVSNGVFQYDYIKKKTYSWVPKGVNIPPCARVVEAQRKLGIGAQKGEYPWNAYVDEALSRLKSSYKRPSYDHDILHDYNGEVIEHPQDNERMDDCPKVFNGKIASSNAVLKDPKKRDELKKKYDIFAIEMETSGIADATWEGEIGYYGIRGICDYCDKYKNNEWHRYAALVAAAYTKAIIEWMAT